MCLLTDGVNRDGLRLNVGKLASWGRQLKLQVTVDNEDSCHQTRLGTGRIETETTGLEDSRRMNLVRTFN
jgi:hypothetical protein